MVAAKAGHKEIVEIFKTKCHQAEPTEEMLVSIITYSIITCTHALISIHC